MHKENKLYAAYGFFINSARMMDVCPTAAVVGTSELKGYRLLFRGDYAEATATVEPDKESSVPVLIWEIAPTDEAALDRFEGFPARCHKESIKVKLDGKIVSAMTYITNDDIPLGRPSVFHYNTIHAGYEEVEFDTDILKESLLALINS